MARVSVVVPAYKAAAFVERTLDTVAAQTFRDFELVVIDDGSPDDTAAVVDRWLRRTGTPGRCVRQQNKKIAGARNAGVREAASPWVAFLDHDDFWEPPKLGRCMAALDADPGLDLVVHHETVLEGGRVSHVHRNGPVDPDPAANYDRMLLGGNTLSPTAVVVRRSKVLEAGGFDEDPALNTVEDYDLWLRLARSCRMAVVDEVLGSYVYEAGGASRRLRAHQAALETLLERHFTARFGPRPCPAARLAMRRRRASACRSALGLLMAYGDDPRAEREYAARMIRLWPFDPKNVARALQWAARRATGPR